jgi:hypothetical protein
MVGKMKKKVKVIIRGDTQHLHKRYRWFCVNSQVLHSPSWWHANEWCLSHSFHVKDNLHKRSNNEQLFIKDPLITDFPLTRYIPNKTIKL